MGTQTQRRKSRCEVPVEKARAEMKELLNAAEYLGQRTVITRHGKASAALVSIADLEKIEAA